MMPLRLVNSSDNQTMKMETESSAETLLIVCHHVFVYPTTGILFEFKQAFHQLLVYADDVNLLGGSVHTIERNIEALVAAGKEIGLAVNADKSKCMFMSRDQNEGRSYNIKTDNSSF